MQVLAIRSREVWRTGESLEGQGCAGDGGVCVDTMEVEMRVPQGPPPPPHTHIPGHDACITEGRMEHGRGQGSAARDDRQVAEYRVRVVGRSGRSISNNTAW